MFSDPFYAGAGMSGRENPTNGSWWLVQILSTPAQECQVVIHKAAWTVVRKDLKDIHQLPLVGFTEPMSTVVSKDLKDIHQLPLVGFQMLVVLNLVTCLFTTSHNRRFAARFVPTVTKDCLSSRDAVLYFFCRRLNPDN